LQAEEQDNRMATLTYSDSTYTAGLIA